MNAQTPERPFILRCGRFDLSSYQDHEWNIVTTQKNEAFVHKSFRFQQDLEIHFTRPHTLWEPLGVQWWKRRNNDNKSEGLDKVARLRVGRWGDKGDEREGVTC